MEIIDHRLVGSLHVDLIDRATAATELAEGAEPAGDAFQTSTIEALLDGAYDGDLTFGELLAHGDLGIGTIDHPRIAPAGSRSLDGTSTSSPTTAPPAAM